MEKKFVVIGIRENENDDLFSNQELFTHNPYYFLQKKDENFLFEKDEALYIATQEQLLAKELGLKWTFIIREYLDPYWRSDIIYCIGNSCVSLYDVADRIEELHLMLHGGIGKLLSAYGDSEMGKGLATCYKDKFASCSEEFLATQGTHPLSLRRRRCFYGSGEAVIDNKN